MSIASEGLVLYYDAKNNTGTGVHDSRATSWKDLSGNNNNGTIYSGTWDDDKLLFNGTSTWVNCGQQHYSVHTIEILIDYDVTSTAEESNSAMGNWQSGGYGINILNGKYNANMHVNNTWHNLSGSVMTTHNPILLTSTYDGNDLVLYENGVEVGRLTKSGTIKAPDSNTVMAIGSNPNGTSMGINLLTGSVYSVRIYDRVLTPEEITDNYLYDYERYLLEVNYRYLFGDGEGKIYQYTDRGFVEIIDMEITSELFLEYGCGNIPSSEELLTLVNPKIYKWADHEKDTTRMTAKIIASPHPQTVVSSEIDLSHDSIKGIEYATTMCDGTLICAISVDDKENWLAHNGEEWITLSSNTSGMSQEQLESLTIDQWTEIVTSNINKIYIRISLVNSEQSVTEIYLKFVN